MMNNWLRYFTLLLTVYPAATFIRPNPTRFNGPKQYGWRTNEALNRLQDPEIASNLVDNYALDSALDDSTEYVDTYSDAVELSEGQPLNLESEQDAVETDELLPMYIAPNLMSYSLQKLQKLLLEDIDEGVVSESGLQEARIVEEEDESPYAHSIRQHKSVDPDPEVGESDNNPGIVVRVTHKAFNFVAVNLMRLFREEINDKPLNGFSRILMRLNVSVLTPRLTEVEMPEISYRALSENSIKMSSIGGSARLNGKYRAVYKTVREGQLTVQMENFDVNVRIKFSKTFAGYLQLVDMSCDAVVRSMVVRLSPKLHEQIDEGLQEAFSELAQQKICEVIDLYIHRIDDRLKTLAQYSPHKSIASQLILDTTLSDEVVLSNSYLDIPLKGAFIGEDVSRTPFYPSPISKSEEETDRMIYVYISDYVINSFFYQLDRLGNFRINLHLIPEIKPLLRLNCAPDEHCIGNLLANASRYANNTGRMEARVRSPPVVVLNDIGAHIGLNLSVEVSYRESDEDDTSRAVLLSTDVKMQLHAANLAIRNTSPQTEHQRLRINTSISISHMEVTSAVAYVKSMNEFASNLPAFLEKWKTQIEDIVRRNLHVVVPLSVNELIGVNSVYGEFRSRTLVLGFDVDLHEKLFEHFSLS